jgi:tetratricopeptide (TPR) repeat protein
VDRAVPERLGDLARGLVRDVPDLDVHADLGALERVPEGSTMVLLPRAEHADALNLGRPVFSRRRLKVVLWCDRETTVALAQQAPDFFDWISEHHDCPPGPVPHAVAGLEAAYEAEAPGILWHGSGDQEDKGRLLAAFSAAFPAKKEPRWIDPRQEYEELLDKVQAEKDAWIACHARAASHIRRLRWAMAERGKKGQAIVVTDTYPCQGWWPVHGRLMPFPEARHALEEAGSPHAGALAALVGLEPEAVDLVGALVKRGERHEQLVELLRLAPDPGASLARMALERGLLAGYEATPPARRAGAGEPDPPELADEIEARIRNPRNAWSAQPGREWTERARLALRDGDPGVAAVWALRAAQKGEYDRDLRRVALELAAIAEPRAAQIQARIDHNRQDEMWTLRFAAWAMVAMAAMIGAVCVVTGERAPALLTAMCVGLAVFAFLVRRKRINPDSPSAINKELELALGHIERGAFDEAKRVFESTVAGTSNLGEEHPLHRRALSALAHVLVEQGEDRAALLASHRVIKLEGRIAGVEQPSFAALIPDLSTALFRTGSARDADALLRKLLGPDAPRPLPGDDEVEATVASSGDDEVDGYLRSFLALPKPRPLSDEHRAEALRLLAEAWITQGRYDEAGSLLERALDQADAALPPDHWRTLTTYGRVLALQRRPAEAEPVLRLALALAEKHAGERHPDTARVLTELARVEHALGQPGAAATARRALAIYDGAQLSDAEKARARAELDPYLPHPIRIPDGAPLLPSPPVEPEPPEPPKREAKAR